MARPLTSIECPACGSPSTVDETRRLEDGAVIRRRRTCRPNGHHFTSWEFVGAHFVRKKSGALETFDRRKLRTGIQRAVEDVVAFDPTDLIEAIHEEALDAPKYIGNALSTKEIGILVLRALKEADRSGVAAIRYGSFYFGDRHFRVREDLLGAIDVVEDPILYVVKSRPSIDDANGGEVRALEPFDYAKLRRAVLQAVRKTARESSADEVTRRVVRAVDLDAVAASHGDRRWRELEARRVGELVLAELSALDWVAYARFLSAFDPERFRMETKEFQGSGR